MLSFRRADINDVEALVRLRMALLRETGNVRAGMSDDELSKLVEAHRQYFTNSVAAEKFIAFVAQADTRIISNRGLVFLERPPYTGNLAGRDAYLMNMYTVPEWRRQGIGARILTLLLASAKEAGAKRVWLHAEPMARRLYERSGFASKTSEMEIFL